MSGAYRAVVMGASAGALETLSAILPELPPDYKLPVMVVVHLPPDKPSLLAELLARKCRVTVREAEDKEPIRPGTVYVSPPDYHLLVEQDGHLSLSADAPVQYSRPSIDVLLESAADAYGETLIGIVLTGANSDGASGLAAIASVGGTALVQNPKTAYAAAMPRAARAACPTASSLTPAEIVSFLLKAASP